MKKKDNGNKYLISYNAHWLNPQECTKFENIDLVFIYVHTYVTNITFLFVLLTLFPLSAPQKHFQWSNLYVRAYVAFPPQTVYIDIDKHIRITYALFLWLLFKCISTLFRFKFEVLFFFFSSSSVKVIFKNFSCAYNFLGDRYREGVEFPTSYRQKYSTLHNLIITNV